MTKRKLKTILYAVSVATLATSPASVSFAQSQQNRQGENALGDFIGMIAQASAKSKAKKRWAQVGPEIQQCVNTTFSSKNVNVDQIIAAGMSPTHKDIAPVIELCQTVMTAQLKTNCACNVANAKGQQVPTTCSQSFAKAVNGKWTPVSRDDFLRAAANDEKVTVTDFETAAANTARLAEERRLAQEAAAREEAARRERLAKEEEERRRFAASPEGKRQAAEQAARQRQAEMKRQAEARLAATPLSPAQARSMLKVWPARRWSSIFESFVSELHIQALQPSVTIKSVTVNRGKCNVISNFRMPLDLKNGQTASTLIHDRPTCNIVSAEVGTSKGIAYFSF